MTGHDLDELPDPDQPRPAGQPAGPTPPPAVQPGYGSDYQAPAPGSGPVPGNPYAQPLPAPLPPPPPGIHGHPGQQPGFGAPLPPTTGGAGKGPFRGRPTLLIAALLAGLLVIGGGAYALVGKGRDKAPAGTGAGGTESATPSGSPSVDKGDGKGPGGGPDVSDLNAGIKPGEAPVWLSENRTEVPGSGTSQYGPWRVGDVVVRAMFKEVTAHAVTDGREKWKVALESPLCGVAPAPSANGKLVVGVKSGDGEGARCTHLQQIDLTTGKAGWKVEVPQENSYDTSVEFRLAIAGDTVAVARSAVVSGFSVTDGRKLFGTSKTGACYPAAVGGGGGGGGGGAKLINVRNCPDPNDAAGKSVTVIEEADPATGAPKWNYQYEKGWNLGRIYSVDPLVVAAYHSDRKVWNITAFTAEGKVRSQTESRFGVPGRCNGWGDGSGDLHGCAGAVVDADTLYIAAGKPGTSLGIDTTDEVVAVDLNSGAEKWHAAAPKDRAMLPLAVEDGKLLVYVQPGAKAAGAVAALPVATGGEPQVVLASPEGTKGAASVFYPNTVRLAWAGGRLFLLNGRVYSPKPSEVTHAVLSFGR
ncbi:PQQ-binding-like beta-propeller repeat protein [Streptomyces sp. NRRL S-244]|uniref:outer membrane protein assembly factor BamB family protein n=1 Tax=Streptomyces sp. NRRL S-244 TaxID=1463897 RepID=UPI00131A5B76|nr:PQQ-binding-like beta-propeller repeat protein [Streptomyces sp. NRRL S-244]